MHQRAFDYSYQAFTADGAQWLVDNTDIALIGIDYLSIAVHDDLTGPHDIVLGAVRRALNTDPGFHQCSVQLASRCRRPTALRTQHPAWSEVTSCNCFFAPTAGGSITFRALPDHVCEASVHCRCMHLPCTRPASLHNVCSHLTVIALKGTEAR